jgi:PAS domain S-box-containing protein
MAVVVVVDLSVDTFALLVQLLLIGPLIAATGATVRQTVVVSVLSVLASVPLVAIGHPGSFGSDRHFVATAVLLIGGALAVVISRLRAQRERDSARLQAQYGVARAIGSAERFDEAAPDLLASIARPLGRELAQYWAKGDDDMLRCVASWREEGLDFAPFERASSELVVAIGQGLPGQAWREGRPVWLGEAIASGDFILSREAEAAGLHGGMAFPVTSGEERIGVIELFSREVRERDPEIYALTEALGRQVGEFVDVLRADEAVRASEARMRAVLESALDAVITMDEHGRIEGFNPAAERLFGYSADAVIGKEMAALVIPPSLRDRHREGLRRHLETGEARILGKRIELIGMRAGGEEFQAELAVNAIAGTDPRMFIGTIRDITARLQAETEREEARAQLEAILRGVADAVTAQAPDGRLLFANDAAVTMLGFESPAALLEAPVATIMGRFEMLDEQGRPFPLEALPGRRALMGEEGAESVVRFRVEETGEERWSAVKATPIRDDDGRVTMAINVIEDITTHKRAEMAQRFLARSGQVLASSLNPDDLLQEIAKLAVPEVADWCAVDLLADNGMLERKALAHVDPDVLDRAIRLSERYPTDPDAPQGMYQVARTGQAELYPEIPDEMLRAGAVDDHHYRELTAIGMRSAIVVPMTTHGRTVGVLTFVSGPSGRRFDQQDVELAQELGRRCATAIDNAQLYADRSYIARTLQQSLLPVELPDIPGVESAARFRPTGEGNEVGGDFYDMFETGPDGWTVVMGDVCGKGPDAAAVTALARYTLRAAAMRERVPSRSLAILNEALLRQRTDRRFCTVAYAYLEKRDDGMCAAISAGGHPLPLLLRVDGSVEQVGAPGTLLGVVGDPDLDDQEVMLHPGDALVFYTDGVIESRADSNGVLDERRLAELVATCAGGDADAIAATVEEAAVLSQHGRPKDDIAVLVLRIAS